MKIETILNALTNASIELGRTTPMTGWWKDRERKVRTFRDRIIRMVEEKDEEIVQLRKELHEVGWVHAIHFGNWEAKDVDIK